jgi:hypothetical protein
MWVVGGMKKGLAVFRGVEMTKKVRQIFTNGNAGKGKKIQLFKYPALDPLSIFGDTKGIRNPRQNY